jgi:hypothetical protein
MLLHVLQPHSILYNCTAQHRQNKGIAHQAVRMWFVSHSYLLSSATGTSRSSMIRLCHFVDLVHPYTSLLLSYHALRVVYLMLPCESVISMQRKASTKINMATEHKPRSLLPTMALHYNTSFVSSLTWCLSSHYPRHKVCTSQCGQRVPRSTYPFRSVNSPRCCRCS